MQQGEEKKLRRNRLVEEKKKKSALPELEAGDKKTKAVDGGDIQEGEWKSPVAGGVD